MPRGTDSLMNPCILIVEQHPASRALLELLLAEEGEIVAADSGEAALMHLGMKDFDCIVVGSPIAVEFGGESSTLLELFDRIAPTLAARAVVITGAGSRAVIECALALEVFAVFTLPFDAAELRECVQRCVRREPPTRRFYEATQTSDRASVARHPELP